MYNQMWRTCLPRVRKVGKQAYLRDKEIHIHTRNLAGNLKTKIVYFI